MKSTAPRQPWWKIFPATGLLLLALPLLAVALAWYALAWLLLHFVIWIAWNSRGRDVLFVYSDSPVWGEYIEEHFLRPLAGRAVVLNWSERKRWRLSLSRIAFRFFGGRREFNPMAVVFRPLRRTRTFRFWTAFRDRKHGRPEALQELEGRFFDSIELPRRTL